MTELKIYLFLSTPPRLCKASFAFSPIHHPLVSPYNYQLNPQSLKPTPRNLVRYLDIWSDIGSTIAIFLEEQESKQYIALACKPYFSTIINGFFYAEVG